jgi:DnaA regulatory inactivator Hda
MTQLLLPLKTPPRYTLETLVIHDGIRMAMESLLPLFEAGKFPLPSTFVHGSAGTGKTHILHALQERLSQPGRATPMAAHFVGPSRDTERFEGLELLVQAMASETAEPCAVLVDDVHRMEEEDAVDLWNLANQLTRFGYPLIMSSRLPPEEIFPDNPHLKSRITAGLVFALEPPEDHVRMMILDKMARDRNIRISPDVTHYLVTHKPRNVSELERIVEELDMASLELKRRITVPLVKLLEKEGAI